MSVVTVCEPCGASSWEVVHRDVMGRGVDLRRCLACGYKTYDRVLMDATEFYTAAPYDEYADRSFRYRTSVPTRQTEEYVAANEAAARAMYAGLLDQIEATVTRRPIRLFEIGCGWGRLLDMARARGYEPSGCDLNGREASNGRGLGLDVRAGDFLSLPLAGPYDAVVGLDVLEHVWRPRALLERAVSLLAPGGAALVKTFYDEWHDTIDLDLRGGAPELWMGGRSHGYFGPVAHPSHFDLPVLRALFARVGLAVTWERVEPIHGQVAMMGVRCSA